MSGPQRQGWGLHCESNGALVMPGTMLRTLVLNMKSMTLTSTFREGGGY